jgi:ATP-binding protein involved in chromosome partitioning
MILMQIGGFHVNRFASGTGDIHLSFVQALPITGVVVVSTPQAVALPKKGVSMFLSGAINVPVLIIENGLFYT